MTVGIGGCTFEKGLAPLSPEPVRFGKDIIDRANDGTGWSTRPCHSVDNPSGCEA
jgi:hypothetical protein